ncbi:MAG: hypothetical protein HKP27_11580 [Myxococcales bacterium]|nr:hypothetical protein [Myxococcales bacterium]
MGRAIGWLLPFVVLLLPVVASACAVCSAREDAARVAFIATTVFLSALPVALIFGVAWWLRKESRAKSEALRTARPGRDPGVRADGARSA